MNFCLPRSIRKYTEGSGLNQPDGNAKEKASLDFSKRDTRIMVQIMKQILVFIVLSTEFLLTAVSPTEAELVDTTAWWLIVSPNADGRSGVNLESLVSLLKDRGKVPSTQVRRLDGAECTRDGIKIALDKLARGMEQDDRLIFYFRGEVRKTSRSLYFLTHGATSDNLARALEDRQLNRWFRKSVHGQAIVILEGYTDENVYTYYASGRETLASAALVQIQPAATRFESPFIERLLPALQDDAADFDENRQVSIAELQRYISNNTSQPIAGILVPTGNIDAITLKLSPMLQVVTVPDSALVFLNGEEIGQTPQRIFDKLEPGKYEVVARKPGYLIPPSRTVPVDFVQGESIHLSWELESIVVSGSVKAPDGVSSEGAIVWVAGTEYDENRLRAEENGQYSFSANIANFVFGRGRSDREVLAPGETYSLRAENGVFYHAEATFTLAPHESLQQDLLLVKKTWFEVAQMRFDRKELETAIAAFQKGIEETTEFPAMSPEFTRMLFDSFSEALTTMDVRNIAYPVTTAKLADLLDLREDAKLYWTQVKLRAAKGSPEHKLAVRRLRKLSFGRYLVNIGVLVILIVVLVSGGYLFQKQRRAKKQMGARRH